jgi:hypothetical protein
MNVRFPRFFSVDSAKAVKAQEFGWLNAINYMAPHKSAGPINGKVINLCSHASAGCIALCLGEHSGQAAMVNKATGTNAVRESRKRKVHYFMRERGAFMNEMSLHLARQYMAAKRKGFELCARLNGATDVAWEGVGFQLTEETAAAINKALRGTNYRVAAGIYRSVYQLFSFIQFVDYTKNPKRFDRALPANLHLTFSLSEDNLSETLELLRRGINVAVVFADGLPATWNGFTVVNGDEHDLRHLDPKALPGQCGYVIGLSPKGNKARKDQSGFVVRGYTEAPLAMAA